MRNYIIMCTLALLSTVFLSLSFAWATGPDAMAQEQVNQIPDRRPAANTIACRDQQIWRLRTMQVHVEHDPLSPQDYSEANNTVAELIRHAEDLQKLCK